jgi:LysM repeat protein
MGMKRLAIALFLVLVLILAACERTAQPSIPEGGEAGEGELPFPTTEFPPMDILETAAAATQTAQAGPSAPEVPATEEPTVETTPAEAVATATPVPTPVPEQPTAVPEEPTPIEPVACSSPYTVSEGEWVYSIGRKCGLDPNAIIAANGLGYPYLLYPGDELVLPSAGEEPPPSGGTCPSPYTVQLGDWVFSIATKCGSTAEAIIAANDLAFPYTIFPGDQLTIP